MYKSVDGWALAFDSIRSVATFTGGRLRDVGGGDVENVNVDVDASMLASEPGLLRLDEALNMAVLLDFDEELENKSLWLSSMDAALLASEERLENIVASVR